MKRNSVGCVRRISSMSCSTTGIGRYVARSVAWSRTPLSGTPPYFAELAGGVNVTASKRTPGSRRAFIAAATRSASSQGAPVCWNGCDVPRPSEMFAASKNTVPG
jgi:hypothetical protein